MPSIAPASLCLKPKLAKIPITRILNTAVTVRRHECCVENASHGAGTISKRSHHAIHSSMACRCADSYHHSHRPFLALSLSVQLPYIKKGHVMQNAQPTAAAYSLPPISSESSRSAVSWSAVFAGTVIAAALSAMLVTGGTGLGFLSMSPWHNDGASGATLAIGSIVWLFASQIIAYGVAGYVTGRLRTKWRIRSQPHRYHRRACSGPVILIGRRRARRLPTAHAPQSLSGGT